jgi:hypothetical protein
LLMQLRSEILGTVRTSVEVADSAWLTPGVRPDCRFLVELSYTPIFSAALVLLRVNMHAHNSIQFTSRNSFKSTPYQFISTICKAIKQILLKVIQHTKAYWHILPTTIGTVQVLWLVHPFAILMEGKPCSNPFLRNRTFASDL